MKYEVGQQVWFVPGVQDAAAKWLTVTAVGRKWAKLSNGMRVPLRSRHVVDGFPGTLFESPEEYEEIVLVANAWHKFKRIVSGRYRANVSLEAIREAAKLLGVEL